MAIEFIGDYIDKLSIINIKIWDATKKAHEAYAKQDQKQSHELMDMIEAMNMQRKEYIQAINAFFSKKKNMLHKKSFSTTVKRRQTHL